MRTLQLVSEIVVVISYCSTRKMKLNLGPHLILWIRPGRAFFFFNLQSLTIPRKNPPAIEYMGFIALLLKAPPRDQFERCRKPSCFFITSVGLPGISLCLISIDLKTLLFIDSLVLSRRGPTAVSCFRKFLPEPDIDRQTLLLLFPNLRLLHIAVRRRLPPC